MSQLAEKIRINNISGVGIAYRNSDPSQVFIEIKDGGHPIPLVRGQLCFIGSNWIGEAARLDVNPFFTFKREFREELSFEKPLRSTEELVKLGLADFIRLDRPENSTTGEPTIANQIVLRALKEAAQAALPFGDYLNTVTAEAMTAADPQNKRGGFTTLASYYLVPVLEPLWNELTRLQNKFGNLSNESITLITSLGEIVERKLCAAFGHDRVLQEFFLSAGLKRAREMALVPHITSVPAHRPFPTYNDYLAIYDVAKRP